MDLIEKMEKGIKLSYEEVLTMKRIVRWSINHGMKPEDYIPTSNVNVMTERPEILISDFKEGGNEEENEEESEEKTKKQIKTDTIQDLIQDVLVSNTETKLTNDDTYKIGKTLGKDAVRIRARNMMFIYPEVVNENAVVEILRDKYDDVIVRNLGGGMFSAYKEKKLSTMNAKSFSVGGKIPEIRTFSFDELKAKLKDNKTKEGAEELKKILRNPLNKDFSGLIGVLKATLENIKVLYHSEYILSCVFFGYVIELGFNSGWDGLKILSVDMKMEEHVIVDLISNFRCDLLLIYGGTLFIVEFKFKYNRPTNTGTQAIECIVEKEYPQRAQGFLQLTYPDLFNSIERVIGLGVGYNNQGNEITCFVESQEFSKTSHSKEFLEDMKKKHQKIGESRDFLKKKRKNESKKK